MPLDKWRKFLLISPFIVLWLICHYKVLHESWLKSYNNHLLAKKRRKKKRILWSAVNERISDVQFRRMFRMSRDCFDTLCQHIISKIGEKNFKSELYIDAFLKGKDQMYEAHVKTAGGYISGEVKLAIALRMLAGGDSYDLPVIFDVHFDHCTRILHEVLLNWIIKTGIGDLNMVKYLRHKEAMAKVSAGFSKRSNGVLQGAIGAIDGWLVRIVRPNWFRDGIKNPTTCFSRKGFWQCGTIFYEICQRNLTSWLEICSDFEPTRTVLLASSAYCGPDYSLSLGLPCCFRFFVTQCVHQHGFFVNSV